MYHSTYFDRRQPNYLEIYGSSRCIHNGPSRSKLDIGQDRAIQATRSRRIPKKFERFVVNSDQASPAENLLGVSVTSLNITSTSTHVRILVEYGPCGRGSGDARIRGITNVEGNIGGVHPCAEVWRANSYGHIRCEKRRTALCKHQSLHPGKAKKEEKAPLMPHL